MSRGQGPLVESRGETFCLRPLNNAFVPCGEAGHAFVFASVLSRSRYEGGAIAMLAVRVQV